MRSALTFVLALSFATSTVACKKKLEQTEATESASKAEKGGTKQAAKGDEEDEPKSAEKAAYAADDALSAKLDLYIRDCLNSFSRPIFDSESRYYSWVDAKKGVTGKESHVYGLYQVSGDPAKCTKAVKDANAKKPNDEKLEAAASAYEKAVAEVVPLLNSAHKYYDQKDYSDDKFAKAKELHPKLVAAWDQFAKADKALGAEVDTQQAALNQRDLVRLEKEEGKKARWHTKNVLLLGKALIKELAVDPSKLELDKLQPALDKFSGALDDFEKWRDKNKSDKDVSSTSSFFSSCQDVVKKTKDTVRRLRDKKPFNASEKSKLGTSGGWMIDGSPDAIFHEWDEVIRDYNTIFWQH